MATEALTVIVIVWSIWKLKIKYIISISLLTPSLSHVTLDDTTSNHLSSRSVTNYLNGPLNLKKLLQTSECKNATSRSVTNYLNGPLNLKTTSVDLWMQKCHPQKPIFCTRGLGRCQSTGSCLRAPSSVFFG